MDKLEVKTFFFAMGDYSRFRILASLAKRDLNVSGIVAATGIEQSNVSHHMSCLLNCGFVKVKRNGKERVYSLNAEVKPMIISIMRHIERYRERIISCKLADMEYISKAIA